VGCCGQLDAGVGGDNVEAYRAQLDGSPSSHANLVVTTDRGPGEYAPYVTQAYVEEAARSLGFKQVARFLLPDKRETRIWWLAR
jgi:hypothetical protein